MTLVSLMTRQSPGARYSLISVKCLCENAPAYLPYIRRNYAEGGWDMKTVYCPYEHAPVGTYVGEIIFLREWLERRLGVIDSLFGYEPSGRE